MTGRRVFTGGAVALFSAGGWIVSRADDQKLPVSDPICTFFGPDHARYVPALNTTAARLTMDVAARLPRAAAVSMAAPPGGTRVGSDTRENQNTIDKYIFQALAAANVAPAPPTTDFEF